MNQDSIFASQLPIGAFPNLFILADGMGGHKAGDYASRYLIDCMVAYISRTSPGVDLRKTLGNGVSLANKLILEKSHSDTNLEGMGTTFVGAVIDDGRLWTINIGDSRLYVIGNGIVQITRDHSLVEEAVSDGLITRDSASYQKDKNMITRAVGVEDNVEYDLFETFLNDGDYVLLCSDGLTNMLSDEEIFRIVKGRGGVKTKSEALIREANERGGLDNISVILIRYRKDGAEHA